MQVRVQHVVMFRRFEPSVVARPDAWFSVGHGGDQYLVHRVTGLGDADQVVRLCAGARRLRDGASVSATLQASGIRVGTSTSGGRVCRVYYEERGDLASH